MTAITIMFLVLFCLAEAIHDYFQEIKDSVKWHAASAAQYIILVLFMVAVTHCGLTFTLSIPRLVLSALLIRWVMLDNVLNVIKGGADKIFYVGTTAFMDRATRFLAKKVNIHPEMLSLCLKIITLITISLL